MSKKRKVLISILLSISIVTLCILCTCFGIVISRINKLNNSDFSSLTQCANKTILFIGDGMGENHVQATSTYYEKEMFMTTFEAKGYVSTFSNSIFRPTDSAAAASSLATGQKFDNKEISCHNGKDIETISEYAKSIGIGVGIVTTDNLNGATPAGFSSHANSRGDSEEIIQGQIESNIDLFLGKGQNIYEPYKHSFENKGYSYSNDLSTLSTNNSKVFGCFSQVVSKEGTNLTPTLEMLTEFAVNFFEENFPDGYFLMIECAHIDKCSHSNNIFEMMEYLNNFDASIKTTHEKLSEQNSVALIVTADHETGGLKNAKSTANITNSLYSQSGHTSQDVPYYIYVNPSKKVDIKQVIKNKIDNTDIFKLCKNLITK